MGWYGMRRNLLSDKDASSHMYRYHHTCTGIITRVPVSDPKFRTMRTTLSHVWKVPVSHHTEILFLTKNNKLREKYLILE